MTDFEFDCAVLEDTGRESEIMLNILVSELFTDRCAVVENDQDSTSTDKMLLELFNDMVKRKEETKAWDIVQRMKLLPYIEGRFLEDFLQVILRCFETRQLSSIESSCTKDNRSFGSSSK